MANNKLFSYTRKNQIYEDAYTAMTNGGYNKYLIEEKIQAMEEYPSNVRGACRDIKEYIYDFLKHVDDKEDIKEINKLFTNVNNQINSLATEMERIINKFKRKETREAEKKLTESINNISNDSEKTLVESKINLITNLSEQLITELDNASTIINEKDEEFKTEFQDETGIDLEKSIINVKHEISKIQELVAAGEDIDDKSVEAVRDNLNTIVDYIYSNNEDNKCKAIDILKQFVCILDKYNDEGLNSEEVWEIQPEVAPSSDENNYY